MQSATDPTDLRVDEDGFVALVAPDAYSGFVDEDWELEDLLARFVEQMNREVLFIAYPGPDDANAALELSPQALSATRRQATGVVTVGEDGLWLTDYTQLTMAAQFADESALSRYAQRLPVEPGRYRITLHEDATRESTFVLTATATGAPDTEIQTDVPWFD